MASYSEFYELWDDIVASLYYKERLFEDSLRDFLFEFMALFLLSLQHSWRGSEQLIVDLILEKYRDLDCTTWGRIEELKSVAMPSSLDTSKIQGADRYAFLTLFAELISDYTVENAHTFDEAISSLPSDINYSPKEALKILQLMGYTRANVKTHYLR